MPTFESRVNSCRDVLLLARLLADILKEDGKRQKPVAAKSRLKR